MSSEEVLSFEIVIDAKLSEETKKSLEELKAGKEQQEQLEKELETRKEEEVVEPTEAPEVEAIEPAVEDLGGPPADIGPEELAEDLLLSEEQLEQIKSEVGEILGGLDKADIAQFGIMAKNPKGFIGGTVGKLFTSGAASVMGPLALAVAAPIVMVEIIKALSIKGGPFNRDWRRFIGNEIAVGLSREQQLEDRFGVSQTILTQIRGFAPNNENWTYNNLYDVNDARIARIGMSDREAGVTIFLP